MSPDAPTTAARRPRPLVGVYLALSVVGLVGTWWFTIAFPLFLALRERDRYWLAQYENDS